MASRSREGRRRSGRAPGVWQQPGVAPRADRPPVQHGVRERGFLGPRLVSAIIILCLVAILFVFFTADAFYVHSIGIAGLEYLSKEEVFALTGIADMHIFWVDPATVSEAILRSPTIAEATVQVGWPPIMVQVGLTERQPALVWQQAGLDTWIDLQGRVMQQREDRTDLLRIVDGMTEGPLGPNVRVEADVVNGALQLRSLYPNIDQLAYDPQSGLGYQDGRGWRVWFGAGTDMPDKIVVYDAIVANLLARGIQPLEINVADPHAPYYSVGGR